MHDVGPSLSAQYCGKKDANEQKTHDLDTTIATRNVIHSQLHRRAFASQPVDEECALPDSGLGCSSFYQFREEVKPIPCFIVFHRVSAMLVYIH
jgi:hypothetical protein